MMLLLSVSFDYIKTNAFGQKEIVPVGLASLRTLDTVMKERCHDDSKTLILIGVADKLV